MAVRALLIHISSFDWIRDIKFWLSNPERAPTFQLQFPNLQSSKHFDEINKRKPMLCGASRFPPSSFVVRFRFCVCRKAGRRKGEFTDIKILIWWFIKYWINIGKWNWRKAMEISLFIIQTLWIIENKSIRAVAVLFLWTVIIHLVVKGVTSRKPFYSSSSTRETDGGALSWTSSWKKSKLYF